MRQTSHPCYSNQAGTGRQLTADQHILNILHEAPRGPAERGKSLLKTTFKALRRVGLRPWHLGASTAAALTLLHHEHGRTTQLPTTARHNYRPPQDDYLPPQAVLERALGQPVRTE